MSLQYELYTVKQIRAIEAKAIETVSESTLMARAGASAFHLLKEQYPDFSTITVLCGAGNNGGDGFVLAKHALSNGMTVTVLTVGEMSNLSDTAKEAYQAMIDAGIKARPFVKDDSFDEADIVVDALLGIGVRGEVTGTYLDAIEAINDCDAYVVSLDLPSGIDADTGCVLGKAVYASMTVTFIGIKQGLLTGEAVNHTGEIFLSTLDVEDEIAEQPISALRLDEEALISLLPTRTKDVHKGRLGHVLVIGGDEGMAGAARLAAEAALRVGAGAVTVATKPEHLSVILSGRPELMCHPILSKKDLLPLLDKADVCVVGPGLSESEWSLSLIETALRFKGLKVIDAGALSYLSKHSGKIDNAVITPHPGEAARLLSIKTNDVTKNRFQAAISLAVQYADVVVLKGAGTLVQVFNEMPELCNLGNPGMATAGMGDVLAGMIAGFGAQGVTNDEAAKLGVVLHALAADTAVTDIGEYGLLASDLFRYFGSAMRLNHIQYDWNEVDES